jgi:proteasome lid subunit RPN8/RPN11
VTSPDLTVERSAHEALLDHARDAVPAEACGVLGGREGRVTRVEPVRNVAAAPETRYELDPAGTVAAVEAVEADADHLGFYHSHPRGPPGPSATDEAAAAWPGFVYCIVSLPEPTVGAWRWTGEEFVPLSVETPD